MSSKTLTDQQVFSIQDGLQIQAGAFIRQHKAEHIDRKQIILDAMKYIKGLAPVSSATAERCAVRALAEYESRNTRCHIDLDDSTAYAVVVNDPLTKTKRVFTVADLMRLVGTPQLAAMPTPSKRAACAGECL